MNAISKVAEKRAGETDTIVPVQPKLDHSKTMKAIVWEGKMNIKCEDKPRPCITHPKDVLLRVTSTTICGSDMHLYANTMPTMHAGDILGHEFMGVIEEAGSEVKHLKVGQRVVVAFNIACGECEYCKRQEYTGCDMTNPSNLMEEKYGHRTGAIYGYSHLLGGVPGGQAEYVRVPLADVNCLIVPDNMPDEKALYLSDIIPTSYHATEIAKVGEGDTVAIWGLGPIGLLAARWCQIRKAKRVIGIDRVPERMQLATSKLGIEVINYKENDIVETLAQLVPGGIDCALECAGFDYAKSLTHKIEMALSLETDSCDILTEMIKTTRKFGRISIIGVYSGKTNHFPIGAMMEKHLLVQGGQCPTQKYWPICLEKMTSGEFDPSFVVTHKAKLSDAPELYEKFWKKSDGVIKVFLTTNA